MKGYIALIQCLFIIHCCLGNNNNFNSKQYNPGGLTEENPNKPIYKAMAEESLAKYLKDIGSWRLYKVLQVNRVTTQIVAGTVTRINFIAASINLAEILACYSEIYEVPWEHIRKIQTSCQNTYTG